MLLPPRRSKNDIKISEIVLNEIKNKQSEKTRSRTEEKKKKIEKKHSLGNDQTKGYNKLRKEIVSLAEDKNTHKKRSSSKSAMMNTTGAALVSTFGAIFGIFGGIVC